MISNYIILFLKGLAMGAVNKIPGVSGGRFNKFYKKD
jgi:uncharacterized membrane protein